MSSKNGGRSGAGKKRRGSVGSRKKRKDRVPQKVDGTFLGETVPNVLKQSMPAIHKLGKEKFAIVLNEAVDQFAGNSNVSGLDKAREASGLVDDDFHAVHTSFITILRAGFRERHKRKKLEDDMKAMNFPEYASEGFVNIFSKRRGSMESIAKTETFRYPTLKNLKWRVDVTISTSSLSRVLKPSVLMEMSLSDGSIKTFEMQIDQFHQLRYNVAKVLKYMRGLESRAIMRLVTDLELGKLKHV
eukprot:g67.t1